MAGVLTGELLEMVNGLAGELAIVGEVEFTKLVGGVVAGLIFTAIYGMVE